MGEFIVILITTSNKKEGERIAHFLVENRLAACVNIVPNIISIYRWRGKVEKSQESLLVIKTKKDLFSKLTREVKKIHSYTVPEIIGLDIVEGSKEYLEWLKNSVK